MNVFTNPGAQVQEHCEKKTRKWIESMRTVKGPLLFQVFSAVTRHQGMHCHLNSPGSRRLWNCLFYTVHANLVKMYVLYSSLFK